MTACGPRAGVRWSRGWLRSAPLAPAGAGLLSCECGRGQGPANAAVTERTQCCVLPFQEVGIAGCFLCLSTHSRLPALSPSPPFPYHPLFTHTNTHTHLLNPGRALGAPSPRAASANLPSFLTPNGKAPPQGGWEDRGGGGGLASRAIGSGLSRSAGQAHLSS